MKMSEEERWAYEHEIMNKVVYQDQIDTARENGWKEGHTAGLEAGQAEGIRTGRESTARNLKALGIDTDIIAQATGLTIEEINSL